jgi:hypothetical protein
MARTKYVSENTQFTLEIDAEWMDENITVDEMLQAESGEVSVIRSILSKGLVDHNGKSIEPETAQVLLGRMKLKHFKEMMVDLRTKLEEGAVPMASEPQ